MTEEKLEILSKMEKEIFSKVILQNQQLSEMDNKKSDTNFILLYNYICTSLKERKITNSIFRNWGSYYLKSCTIMIKYFLQLLDRFILMLHHSC